MNVAEELSAFFLFFNRLSMYLFYSESTWKQEFLMKKIFGLAAFSCLLFSGGGQEALAGDLISDSRTYSYQVEGYYNKATAYQKSKDYNDITNKTEKYHVKTFCSRSCGQYTCRQSERLFEACHLICPPKTVENCKKY